MSRCSRADDGSLLRELTLDPSRDYQPRGVPAARPSRARCPETGVQVSGPHSSCLAGWDMSRDGIVYLTRGCMVGSADG